MQNNNDTTNNDKKTEISLEDILNASSEKMIDIDDFANMSRVDVLDFLENMAQEQDKHKQIDVANNNPNNSNMKKKHMTHCSFCGRPREDVKLFYAIGDVAICDKCVEEYHHMNQSVYISQKRELERLQDMDDFPVSFDVNIPCPHDIKSYLDEYVIGQDEAKKTLAVAVYNHYKRIKQKESNKNLPEELRDVDITKSNVLMCGPTGCGKTELARTIANLLDVPFAIADATVFTEAGYVGEDVESIITRLLQACNYDVKKCEMGIIYLDEGDKLTKKGANPSITRDVNGEGVQQALLKMLEGTTVLVPPQGGRKHPDAQMVSVNTKNILFIMGGAFVGLENIIKSRMNTKSVGFNTIEDVDALDEVLNDDEHILQNVTPQDLRSFGFIPELIGRMPVIVALDELDKNALKKILTEPKNAVIKQFRKLLALDGIGLNINDDVYDYIVQKAIDDKTGARGLRAAIEKVMKDYMFDAPSMDVSEITITLDYVKNVFGDKSETPVKEAA